MINLIKPLHLAGAFNHSRNKQQKARLIWQLAYVHNIIYFKHMHRYTYTSIHTRVSRANFSKQYYKFQKAKNINNL